MAGLLNLFRKNSLEKRLEKIHKGDQEEREKIIEEYIPFIIKTVSNKINRYIESENSEEYSIGMEAFNEAIDKYQSSRGSFIGFAELVIKSRITDYLRKSMKHSATISISQMEEDENHGIQKQLSMDDFTDNFMLRDEIEKLQQGLDKFHITFSDLVREAPKHADTRANGLRIAKYIADSEELKEELMRKRALPTSKLVSELHVTEKILKRSRKFIIVTVLILDSDLALLKDYISRTQGGVTNGI